MVCKQMSWGKHKESNHIGTTNVQIRTVCRLRFSAIRHFRIPHYHRRFHSDIHNVRCVWYCTILCEPDIHFSIFPVRVGTLEQNCLQTRQENAVNSWTLSLNTVVRSLHAMTRHTKPLISQYAMNFCKTMRLFRISCCVGKHDLIAENVIRL